MMNRIVEYERKLSGMRTEFNALLGACAPEHMDEIARLKINELSGEIESLEKQVKALEAAMRRQGGEEAARAKMTQANRAGITPGMPGTPGTQRMSGAIGTPEAQRMPGANGEQGVLSEPGMQSEAGMNRTPGAQRMSGANGEPGMQSEAGMNGMPGMQRMFGANGAPGTWQAPAREYRLYEPSGNRRQNPGVMSGMPFAGTVPPGSAAGHPAAVPKAPVPPDGGMGSLGVMSGMPFAGAVPPGSAAGHPGCGPAYGRAPQAAPARSDMEKTIGRSVMGICASGLIFISIIFFAALVLPYLNDTITQVLMYGAGIACASAGILFLVRDRGNKWFLALAGCGMGIIYLSLFLSCFYFGSLGDTALYLWLFMWAAVVCGLSRMRSELFQVIGQMGIALSVLLGVSLCAIAQDASKLLFLVIYGVISETIYYIAHFQKEYHRNLISHIFWCFIAALLLPGVCARYTEGTPAGTAAALVTAAAVLLPMLTGIFAMHVKEDDISFGVINLIGTFQLFLTAARRPGDAVILMAVFSVVMLVLLEVRFRAQVHYGRTIFQCALFFAAFCAVLHNASYREYVSVAPFVLVCLIYGFCRNNNVYRIAGLCYAVLLLLIPMNGCAFVCWGTAAAACTVFLLVRFREQYRVWMKLVAYLLFLAFLTKSSVQISGMMEIAPAELRVLVTLVLLAAANIAMQKLPALHRDPRSGKEEPELLIGAGVVQVLLMLAALACIWLMEEPLYHISAAVFGVIVFSVNFTGLIRAGGEGFGLYAGIKYLILILSILGSYEAPGYLISLAGLSLAIVCIVSGFLAERKSGRNYKTVRVYGLVLSLVSVIKLVLIDISYDSMLLRAVSFFVSGVLCFAISFIYDRMDRRFR